MQIILDFLCGTMCWVRPMRNDAIEQRNKSNGNSSRQSSFNHWNPFDHFRSFSYLSSSHNEVCICKLEPIEMLHSIPLIQREWRNETIFVCKMNENVANQWRRLMTQWRYVFFFHLLSCLYSRMLLFAIAHSLFVHVILCVIISNRTVKYSIAWRELKLET